MKIGVMNNPTKSIYDEAAFCHQARFDFLDLTIEGHSAHAVDAAKLCPVLEEYGLDNIKVEAEPGSTVLEAAKKAVSGIFSGSGFFPVMSV